MIISLDKPWFNMLGNKLDSMIDVMGTQTNAIELAIVQTHY